MKTIKHDRFPQPCRHCGHTQIWSGIVIDGTNAIEILTCVTCDAATSPDLVAMGDDLPDTRGSDGLPF